jgi:hypothetical protein
LPDDTPQEHRRALVDQQHRLVVLERWPELSLPALNGKSPREAAAEPDYHVRILAAILLLELAAEASGQELDFNEVRGALGLPTREMIDPSGVDASALPVVRLLKLDAGKLSDDDLITVFERTVVKRYRKAACHFALEVVGRDQMGDRIDKGDAYDVLISFCYDSDEALQHLASARRYSQTRGDSPARWLVAELSIRLRRLEVEQFNQLLQTLQARHWDEPGVAQAVQELLVRSGLMTPDGRPVAPPPSGQAETVGAPPQPSPPTTTELWTPDSAQAAPPSEGKSKLWVPGSD